MHKLKEDLPVMTEAFGARVRGMGDMGGMFVAYTELPAGLDLTPTFEGLPDNMCPCPHWGYILKGSIHLRYTDGVEEVIKAGEVFYMPPGHTAWLEEDTAFIEISPEKAYNQVVQHSAKKMGA